MRPGRCSRRSDTSVTSTVSSTVRSASLSPTDEPPDLADQRVAATAHHRQAPHRDEDRADADDDADPAEDDPGGACAAVERCDAEEVAADAGDEREDQHAASQGVGPSQQTEQCVDGSLGELVERRPVVVGTVDRVGGDGVVVAHVVRSVPRQTGGVDTDNAVHPDRRLHRRPRPRHGDRVRRRCADVSPVADRPGDPRSGRRRGSVDARARPDRQDRHAGTDPPDRRRRVRLRHRRRIRRGVARSAQPVQDPRRRRDDARARRPSTSPSVEHELARIGAGWPRMGTRDRARGDHPASRRASCCSP